MSEQLVDLYINKTDSKLILFGQVNLIYGRKTYLVSGDSYNKLMRHMKRVCTEAGQTIDDSVGATLVLTDHVGTEVLKNSTWELCRIDNRLCWRRI